MPSSDDRDARNAMIRGLRLACPACGTGRMFDGYLKVRTECDTCGQKLHHARVDDGPAYFTLSLVVAIVFPLFAVIYSAFDPEPLWVALGMMAFATALALVLLPRVKGLFIGLQWAKRLHGF